ncbi:hypothetical protein ACK6D9_00705 [Hoeflea sp. Naph1]|uniref:hypothetical protein n=1 Tax=Hoeflea sp. Naph1 TaxID=3388653 RepID=UPI0039900CB7
MEKTAMKKPIKIDEENRPAILEAFKLENGRATANTLSGAEAFRLAIEAEQELEKRGIPLSKRKGAQAIFSPSGPANAYQYSMLTTFFEIERNSQGWRLMSVRKVTTRPRSTGGMGLIITREQANIITKKALEGLHVAQYA